MKRLMAWLVLILCAVWLVACIPDRITATVDTPFCPISDSAWANTDYAPLGCVKP
jgi:hypothetical protein